MTRCDVSLCNDPISKTGFVCCVCEHAFCKLHGGPGGKEMGCCENCTRECMFCGKITNAGDGIHVRDDFKCAECIDGLLYTSDAADDLLCVDLGGRRIIKKKKMTTTK